VSQRTRVHRPATLCRKATGAQYRKCLAWEEAGLISFPQPVPDALSRDQRRFEAMITLVLAKALCDRQLDGALLGFHRVEPSPDGIVLYPHTAMAKRLIRELLPRLDDEYEGQLRGVPGLRPRWQQGTIVLYDVTTSAQVRVIWRGCPPLVAVDLESPGVALWRHDVLDAEEATYRLRWTGEAYANPKRRSVVEAAARDWLLSRILRRLALVNQGASSHGFANTYSHVDDDLVVESCCGTDPAKSKRLLVRSGLATPPEDPLLAGLEGPRQGAGQINLGGRIGVTFRCLHDDECTLEPGRANAYIDQQRREWYS
jgi:hypothetical protein